MKKKNEANIVLKMSLLEKSDNKSVKKVIKKELKLVITDHQPFDLYGNFISSFRCVYKHPEGGDCDCEYPDWYKKYLMDDKEID
jgi:hypothetical protein